MFKAGFATSVALIALLATLTTASSQEPPTSGTYKIQSGSYSEIGGFVGSITYQLPGTSQAFVSLVIGPGGVAAELTFLDNRQQAVFLRLTNGIVSGNTIRFQYMTVHPYGPPLPPARVDYMVTNAAGRLWISGSITSTPVCCDIPYTFEHRDVLATFVPALSIRAVGEVELCWKAASNQNYQVQYQSDFTRPVWTNLGGPVRGSGSTKCVVDSSAPEHLQRFYRVITLP
jgi:hypothetical protein